MLKMTDQIEYGTGTNQNDPFKWTFSKVIWAIFIFCLAGVAEIIGGWMVWSSIRGSNNGKNKKPFWFAIVGSMLLVIYGFIPCLQPTDSFGRVYAVYGGFFIVLSFLIGWGLDGDQPDLGDAIGGILALIGVMLILFWPRDSNSL